VAHAEIIDDLPTLAHLAPAWDALAIARARPYCSPAWMLSWWRHAAPTAAALRTIVTLDGDELIGVAPFFVTSARRGPARYRLLASGASMRTEPLAATGREAEVAAALVRGLKLARPAPDAVALEGTSRAPSWARLLLDAWPDHRPPWLNLEMEMPAPVLSLEGRSYEEWFASKTANFRQQMRRGRRRLERRGAVFRMARTEEELRAGLTSFASLHYKRWASRGGSVGLDSRVEEMLRDAGARLLRDARFRLWSIDVEGRAISSQIFVEAGGEVTYWNGGFDEAWASYDPALHTILAALEHAWGAGARRFDLGGGGQSYKYRFAEEDEFLEWVSLVPRGSRYHLTRLQLAPVPLRRAIANRLSPTTRARIKKIVGRR
jgi:CelD/BcsL family acetyltransferase involved in cellulose biosynthesis